MWKIILVSGLTILLASCVPVPTPLSATASPTSLPTETPLPTETRIPTITSTPRPTATATLAPEQYPALIELALDIEDLPLEFGTPFVAEFFGSFPVEQQQFPIIEDQTELLVSQGRCHLDCNRRYWFKTGRSISITMIRIDSRESARSLSDEDYQTNSSDAFFIWDDNGVENAYWAMVNESGHYLFGTFYGPIYIFADYHIQDGSDNPSMYVDIIQDAVNLQIDKLRQAGIPRNP